MQTIDEYLNTLKANGLSKSVLKNAKVALRDLNKFKPLAECTKEDITQHIVDLMEKYKPSTLQVKKIQIKQYYEAQDKPELVEHIKIKRIQKELDANEILTVSDVNALIQATSSPKYKALIAVLWETAGRISEVLAINKAKDLTENQYGYEVRLYASKTAQKTGKGYRKMLLTESAPFIRDYLLNTNHTDSRLFPLAPESVTWQIKKLGKEIGRPDIYPHLFRHSRATQLVKDGVQESMIRRQLGWTPDSEMISRYIHLNDDDLIQDQLQRAGVEKEKKEPEKLIKPEKSQLDVLQEENQKMKKWFKFVCDDFNEKIKTMEERVLDNLVERYYGTATLPPDPYPWEDDPEKWLEEHKHEITLRLSDYQ